MTTYLLQHSRTKFFLQQELPLINCINSVTNGHNSLGDHSPDRGTLTKKFPHA